MFVNMKIILKLQLFLLMIYVCVLLLICTVYIFQLLSKTISVLSAKERIKGQNSMDREAIKGAGNQRVLSSKWNSEPEIQFFHISSTGSLQRFIIVKLTRTIMIL